MSLLKRISPFDEAEAERFMARCVQLAKGGCLLAAPNPMVGAVIVHEGRIIGEGFHACCGEAHAEVNAINSVRPADRKLIPESTLYVSLEPCAHYGKTPPCAELIIRERIPRVVVSCIDTFTRVKGKGVTMLRDAGVQVIVGVLEDECRRLNRAFFCVQEKSRPFITLKWARSVDGFIDRVRMSAEEPAARLSSLRTLLRVHRLRAEHQAILVGHRTLSLDHPKLSVRHWAALHEPMLCVIGTLSPGEVPKGFNAFSSMEELLNALREDNVQSLLVEGGRFTLQRFIDAGLWDEVHEEVSPKCLVEGVQAPEMPVPPVSSERLFTATINHWKR